MSDILDRLAAVIADRKENPKKGSYVCSLLRAGENEILRKIGEESIEVILAAKSETDHRVVEESADLLFHLLVLLGSRDIELNALFTELEERFGRPKFPAHGAEKPHNGE